MRIRRRSVSVLVPAVLILAAIQAAPTLYGQSFTWQDTLALHTIVGRQVRVGPDAVLFVSARYEQDGEELVHGDFDPLVFHLHCYTSDGLFRWEHIVDPMDSLRTHWAPWWGSPTTFAAAGDDGTFWFWYHGRDSLEASETWSIRLHLGADGTVLARDSIGIPVSRVYPDGSATSDELLPERTGHRFIRWASDLRSTDTVEFIRADIEPDPFELTYDYLWIERDEEVLVVRTGRFFGRSVVMRKGRGESEVTTFIVEQLRTPGVVVVDAAFVGENLLLLANNGWIGLVGPDGAALRDTIISAGLQEKRIVAQTPEGSIILSGYADMTTGATDLLILASTFVTDRFTAFDENLGHIVLDYHQSTGLFLSGELTAGNPDPPPTSRQWNIVGRILGEVSGVKEVWKGSRMDLR